MPDTQTHIDLHYLLTLYVALEPARQVSAELSLHPGRPGGWVQGPFVTGDIVPPSGDWLRRMRNGTCRLDVRIAILADDGSHILMSYHGRIADPERNRLRPKDGPIFSDERYFLISAVFETDSEKYGWLNDIVAVGKNVPTPAALGPGVTHELYAAY